MHEFRGHLVTFASVLALAGSLVIAGQQTAYGAPPAEDVICTGCIDTSDIADSAVTGGKIADGAVGSADIADSAVGSAEIADGAVGAADLADGSVTAWKLAEDAIFAHVITVRSDDLPTENCDALKAVLGSLSGTSETNRYLVRLDAGVYDCGVSTDGSSLLDVYPYVTLQGAGVFTTKITGDAIATQKGLVLLRAIAELRDLTVENRRVGYGNVAIAVSIFGGPAHPVRITNVAVTFPPAPDGATGIRLGSGTTTIRDVQIDIPDATGSITGILMPALGGTANLENVKVTAGSTPASTQLLSVASGHVTVRDSVLTGLYGGGVADAVTVSNGGTADFVSTEIDGHVTDQTINGVRCVNSYDGDYVPLPADCGATY